MTTAAQINSAIADLVADATRLQSIINGDANTNVLLEDGISSVPTIAKLFSQVSDRWRPPVRLATTGALANAPTYGNGAAGVGATLTATVNGALTVDNRAAAVGNRIVVKDQAAQLQNGIYIVTAAGSGAAPYVLTRAADADSPAELVPGMGTTVTDGDTNAGAALIVPSPTGGSSFTIGTTAITFNTQVSIITPTDYAGILRGTDIEVTGAYPVTQADSGGTICCGGNAFYAVTLDVATNYTTKFSIEVKNCDALRRKDVVVPGYGTVRLYPDQDVTIRRRGTGFNVLRQPGRWRITSDKVLFANDSTGSVNNDGLHASSPLPSQEAINRAVEDFESAVYGGAHVTIQWTSGVPVPPGLTVTEPVAGAIYIIMQGDAANDTAVQMNAASAKGIYVKHRGFIKLKHIEVYGLGAEAVLWADRLGGIDLYYIVFGSTDGGVMIRSTEGASVEFAAVCSFGGSAWVVISAERAGRVNLSGFLHQFISDAVWGFAFISSTDHGWVGADPGGGFALNGHAISGKRAYAAFFGTVHSGTGVPNTFFPGNVNVDNAGGPAAGGGWIQ